ncbi:hypothetical protein SAMN04487864_1222, partial [Succiniclasticum ruminis]
MALKNYGTAETPFYEEDKTLFEIMLGKLPKRKKDAERMAEGIGAILLGRMGHSIFDTLGFFLELSIQERVIQNYHAGAISAGLSKILKKNLPKVEENLFTNFKAWQELISERIQEGKADFSSFKGPQDAGETWILRYAINPYILSIYMKDSLPVTESTMKDRKAEAAQRVREAVAAALDETTAEQSGKKAQKETALLKYVKALEHLYEIRTGAEPELHFVLPERIAFYMNPVTGEVIDLRPYAEEIHSLIAPVSWRYILDYTGVITDYLAKRKELQKEAQHRKSIFDKAFIKMFNSTPTNELVNLNTTISGDTQKNTEYFQQNLFEGEWNYKKGGTEVFLPIKMSAGNVLPPIFSTSTQKTMHFISLLFTAHNSAKRPDNVFPIVETSVREYMAATGRKQTLNNVKETTKILKRDLDTLAKISLKYNDKKYSLSRVNPFAETHMERGKIKVVLAPTFAEFLVKTTGFLMNYPAALLKLKENNSNIYPLGYKLALNRSNDANIRKGKANILSVPVCLEACLGLPDIESVKKQHNSPAKRIIEPFEKALDSLQQQGVLERWEYCQAKGEPLGQPAVTDYNYFTSLYILYEIKDFP